MTFCGSTTRAGPLRTYPSACTGRQTTVVWVCQGAEHQLGQEEHFVALIPWPDWVSGTVLVRKVTWSQNARDVLATLPVFHMCAGGTPGHLPLCGLNNPQVSKWSGQRSVQACPTTQLENKQGLKPGTDTRNGSLLEHVWYG